jgi:hypothetical protein
VCPLAEREFPFRGICQAGNIPRVTALWLAPVSIGSLVAGELNRRQETGPLSSYN